MTDVQIAALSKRFGQREALAALHLSVASGEFVTLLGPSGCGKTTTLRCIAGLETPTAGRITLGGRTVVDVASRTFVPPERRNIGMVFQSYALWPHMTVGENVAYPLKVARVGAGQRRSTVQELLDTVGLGAYVDTSVAALSGGQQQRVALARALVARPQLIVYDEPLSNLDTKLRYRMSQQIRGLHDRFGTTSIYVTHDQEEALTLSDRIVVMNDGRIEQSGAPNELYESPASVFVADFMGYQNILAGAVAATDGRTADVRLDDASAVLRGRAASGLAVGERVRIAFRSAQVRLVADGDPASAVDAVVERSTYIGGAVNLLLAAGALSLRIRVDGADLADTADAPGVGDRVRVAVLPQHAVVLPEPTAASLATPADAAQLVGP